MAVSARDFSAPPEMTPHVCAIESILHSSLAFDPSGAPSSKYALLYQAPSQPFFSTAAAYACALRSSSSRAALSPRLAQCAAKRRFVATRNHASHTLSPFPSIPTRFIPSFQSPLPISGSPRGPVVQAFLSALR